jgi:hypothetical protein
MTDKNYNKRGRLIKSIRAILFILLLIFCGLMIYYELNSDSLPIYLIISGILIVPGVILIREFDEDLAVKKGKIKKYGRRIWFGPHLIIGMILGLIFILTPILLFSDITLLFSMNTVIGFSILFASIINVRGFYISLYKKQIVTDGLNIYKIAKINSIKIQEDKLLMKVNHADKTINLLKISDDERNDLITELKERLPDVWQQA